MNSNIFKSIIAMTFIAVAFTSCSDDDDAMDQMND